jgi:hypothetical protein
MPDVVVKTTPKIYSGIHIEDQMTLDILSNLQIDIYASDPENEELTVFLALGYESLAGSAIFEMNLLRERIGKLISLEDTGDVIVGAGVDRFVEQVAPPAHRNVLIPSWYRLAEQTPGHYVFHFPYGVGIELESPLDKV